MSTINKKSHEISSPHPVLNHFHIIQDVSIRIKALVKILQTKYLLKEFSISFNCYRPMKLNRSSWYVTFRFNDATSRVLLVI